MRKQLFFNLNWLVAERIVRVIGSLIIGIWVARYLGPKSFGLLNFSISFVALFGMFGRLSIDQVVVRELSKYPEKENQILGSIFRLKLWGSLVAIIFVLPVTWLAQPDNPIFLILVLVTAAGILFNAIDAIDIFYQAKISSKFVVQARTIAFLIFAVVRVGMILGRLSVIWFAVAATLELAFAAGLIAWVYQIRESAFLRWRWHGATAWQLLKDGWPLIASSLLIVVHMRIDQVMIGQMLGELHVGLYSAAIRISEAWLFVPGLIVQTSMPYFVKLREQNSILYQQRLMQLYSAMFWTGVIAGIVTLLVGRNVIVLLFGESYTGAYGPLVLIIWTGIFNAQAVARGVWMISENLQLYRLFTNLVAVPLNVVLNILWIPRYGINGAAAASLVSIGVGTWIIPFIFRPMRKSNTDLVRSVNPKYLFVKS